MDFATCWYPNCNCTLPSLVEFPISKRAKQRTDGCWFHWWGNGIPTGRRCLRMKIWNMINYGISDLGQTAWKSRLPHCANELFSHGQDKKSGGREEFYGAATTRNNSGTLARCLLEAALGSDGSWKVRQPAVLWSVGKNEEEKARPRGRSVFLLRSAWRWRASRSCWMKITAMERSETQGFGNKRSHKAIREIFKKSGI